MTTTMQRGTPGGVWGRASPGGLARDTKTQKDTCVHASENLILLQGQLHKAIDTGKEKKILKFMWNLKGPWTAKAILRKSRKLEVPHLPI